MSTPLQDLVAAELAASGLDGTELNPSDVAYVENGIRSVLSGLKARRTWENHIGAILTHKQVLDVTGWTKQALSQAVRDYRVLRLVAADGSVGYSAAARRGRHCWTVTGRRSPILLAQRPSSSPRERSAYRTAPTRPSPAGSPP